MKITQNQNIRSSHQKGNSICPRDIRGVGGITPVTAARKDFVHWWRPSGSDVQACSAYCRLLFGPYSTQQYDPLVPFTLLCLLGQVRSSLGSIILACYCFGSQWWPVCILPQVLVQTLDCWVKMQHTSHGGNAPNCWSSRLNFKPQTKTDGWDMMHVHDFVIHHIHVGKWLRDE